MKTKTKLAAALMLALAGAFAAVGAATIAHRVVTDSMCGARIWQGQDSRRMHPIVRERRHEVRSGRGEKGLHLKDTKRNSPSSLARKSRPREL